MTPTFAAQFARLGKAIASPQRVMLLDLLAQGERPVEAVASATGLSVANASQHLRHLLAAHLVINEKRGLQVFYRIAGTSVLTFLACLQRTAEAQLAEMRVLTHETLSQEDLESIGMAELRRRMTLGEAVVIDVRPADEFAAGHLPGAISIPMAELAKRMSGLPKQSEVVAYCRGPYCAMSADAVRRLRRAGYRARRLPDGPIQWALSGDRTATGGTPAASCTTALARRKRRTT